MYKSKEIRWFFKENNTTITKWLSKQGKELSKTQPRTDYYLPIAGKEDISVKLREGNVEIKQRHGQQVLHDLTKYASGYLEDWIKWSFDVGDNDALAKSIIKGKKYNWIEVHKYRIGVKITANPDDSHSIHDIRDFIPSGCQIEYTRLMIEGNERYTFGLEWFGDEYVELDTKLIEDVLGDTKLESKDSMGYAQFLIKQTK